MEEMTQQDQHCIPRGSWEENRLIELLARMIQNVRMVQNVLFRDNTGNGQLTFELIVENAPEKSLHQKAKERLKDVGLAVKQKSKRRRKTKVGAEQLKMF